jgi:SAM-dependent methyltransferase
VWEVLCTRFFQPLVRESDTVLDMGAGHGEFLRHIRCAKKIAVELNPDARQWLPPEIALVKKAGWDIGEIGAAGVDLVFASNFFEHLPTKEKLLITLAQIHRVLRPGGSLCVLQPNLAYLHGRFFDFLDHHLPLTHNSMIEALAISGFTVKKCIPRFLPFTTRSRIPQSPWLVKLYLACPPAWLIMGKQMFIHALKASNAPEQPNR